MYRVYIPIEPVTIAHVVRPLEIAKVLRREGIQVVFGMNDRYRSFVEKENFTTLPLFAAPSEVLMNAVRTVNFTEVNAQLENYFQSDIVNMKKLGVVDLVLSDFRFTARYAAKYLEIPFVSLVNGFFSPYYAIEPSIPKAIMPGLPGFIRDSYLVKSVAHKAVLNYHGKPYRHLCAKYGIPATIRSAFHFSVSDDLTLLCDLPVFTPQNESLPEHYQFTGPIFWEPEKGETGHLDIPDLAKKGLIYVTLGTSGEVSAFSEIIKALGQSPCQVILSTGGEQIQGLPENIHAVSYAKPSEILPHAKLMICHGGNGSIYQAAKFGVPVLCITSFYDQEWNGQRVSELGFGDAVYCKEVTHENIAAKIENLISNPVYSQTAGNFKAVMSHWNGAENAAAMIQSLLKKSLNFANIVQEQNREFFPKQS